MVLSSSRIRALAVTIGGACCVACASLVDVDTPGVINDDQLDPERDGRIFSLSARQNFADAYAQVILFGAWFGGEAISAEVMPQVAEFDRRAVSADNPDLLTLWGALSVARETAERVVRGLTGDGKPTVHADRARAALFAGYSYLLMAEHFCEGAVPGARLAAQDMLGRSGSYFSIARTSAQAALQVPADSAEADAITNASFVGAARARLQLGDATGAIAAAQMVATTFVMNMWYADAASPNRLANVLWANTETRGTLGVAPAFRDLDDPRVPVAAPATNLPPFDGVTPFWTQRKYASFGASIRLASGLEARYIEAEARGPSAMLALIQARRLANGQLPYSGATDLMAVTVEFMAQRARDFFLEGKRVGDIRRQPGRVPDVRAAGSPYHKPGFAPVGNQTCWPLPTIETQP